MILSRIIKAHQFNLICNPRSYRLKVFQNTPNTLFRKKVSDLYLPSAVISQESFAKWIKYHGWVKLNNAGRVKEVSFRLNIWQQLSRDIPRILSKAYERSQFQVIRILIFTSDLESSQKTDRWKCFPLLKVCTGPLSKLDFHFSKKFDLESPISQVFHLHFWQCSRCNF